MWTLLTSVRRRWQSLSFRARVLGTTWLVFVALVSCKLHGSSVAFTTQQWAPESATDHFLAAPLLKAMSPEAAARWRVPLMAAGREIRMDEWGTWTPWALSQFSARPRFPVVNDNIGRGQNMLIAPWAPVAHVSTLARPMTWGYFFLGPERGLAWAWWSQALGCFAALYLLFELIVPRRPWIAVLGAGWFSSSAYVVYFSLWPAYVVWLGALAVVCAYWLVFATRPSAIIASGLGLGLSVAGSAMQLYPPWQIPLAEMLLIVLVALLVRDRRQLDLRRSRGVRLCGLGLTLASLALVAGTFVVSTREALQAFVNSEYPGQRRLLGGDLPTYQAFAGIFNYFLQDYFARGINPSESANFFLLFPAVPVAALASPRIRVRLGPMVWALLALLGLIICYGALPLPAWLARATLLTFVPGRRAIIALGLGSIIVCVRLLAVASESPLDRESVRTGLLVFVTCAALYYWQGFDLQTNYAVLGSSSHPRSLFLVATGAAAIAALLAAGARRCGGALLGAALLVTSATFNPLSVGLNDWRSSELASAVRSITEHESPGAGRSLWLTYGGSKYPGGGIVGQMMGARTLAGVYGYPQVDFWAPLDPDGKNEKTYNRFAIVHLMAEPATFRGVRFGLASFSIFRVFVSPLNPTLRQMGARYVLTLGPQPFITDPPFKPLYTGKGGDFTIWELPPLDTATSAATVQ